MSRPGGFPDAGEQAEGSPCSLSRLEVTSTSENRWREAGTRSGREEGGGDRREEGAHTEPVSRADAAPPPLRHQAHTQAGASGPPLNRDPLECRDFAEIKVAARE